MVTNRDGLLQSAELPKHTVFDRLLRANSEKNQNKSHQVQFGRKMLDEPHTFQVTEEGNGIFGQWVVDKDRLPAYEYTFDHLE